MSDAIAEATPGDLITGNRDYWHTTGTCRY